MKYFLAAIDGFLDLKTIPSAIVLAKNFIRRKIKLEDLASLIPRTGRKHPDHEISKDPEKEDHEHRYVRYDQHRRDHNESECVLALLLDRVRDPFLEFCFAHLFDDVLRFVALLIGCFTRVTVFRTIGTVLVRADRILFILFHFEAESGHHAHHLVRDRERRIR